MLIARGVDADVVLGYFEGLVALSSVMVVYGPCWDKAYYPADQASRREDRPTELAHVSFRCDVESDVREAESVEPLHGFTHVEVPFVARLRHRRARVTCKDTKGSHHQ